MSLKAILVGLLSPATQASFKTTCIVHRASCILSQYSKAALPSLSHGTPRLSLAHPSR
jgi:hypothetical protein